MQEFVDVSDEDLVCLTLNGNNEAFGEIVNRYQEAILRYCKRLLSYNYHDAEDITAEVFFKAYKNLASFKTQLKFSSWLYRIAHNTAVNMIRDKSKFILMDIENFLQIPSRQKTDLPIDKTDLEQILAELTPVDRSLLILFHIEEKSLKEIGSIFKLTENTVAVKLKRARQRARKIINR